MALDYTILNNKKTLSKEDTGKTEDFIDLLTDTIDKKINYYDNLQVIQVEKEYVARPDLISFALYKTDMYADIICKINGISNPFELNEGQILLCPHLSVLPLLMSTVSDDIEGIYNKDSKNSTSANSDNNFKKKQTDKRSPNEATETDHNYTLEYNNTIVFY